MFIVFYTVKIVYNFFHIWLSLWHTRVKYVYTYICISVHKYVHMHIYMCTHACMCVCMSVPIRQHGVITQTTTIETFNSTKTSNPTYHIVLITLYKTSAALQMSQLYFSLADFWSWLELRQYQPSGICIEPMCADILMNGDDKKK